MPAEAEAVREAVARVIHDGHLDPGARRSRVRGGLRGRYADLHHAVGVGNGTDALAVAFTALGLSRGAGVLLAANEGGYAATAARLAGLEPVVMDVDARSMAPTVETARAAHRPGVEAIVVTHLHGDAVELTGLDGVATHPGAGPGRGLRTGARPPRRRWRARRRARGRRDVQLLPDQEPRGRRATGAVGFTDEAVAARARSLRQYGWGTHFRAELPHGRNTRLDPLQAAVLTARLPFLDERNARRRAVAASYAAALDSSGRLHGDRGTTVAHHAVVVTPLRDGLAAHLATAGIDTAVHYPYLVDEMPG